MEKNPCSCLHGLTPGMGAGGAGPCIHPCLCPAGKNPTDEYLEGMMSEAPGPINFTMFLTMFGEKLNGTDPEDVIRNAFACFDEEASGTAQPLGLTASTGAGPHPWGQSPGSSECFGCLWEGRGRCRAQPSLLMPSPALLAGFIHEDHLRELLTTMGDRFTDEEVDEMYREAPIDKKGNFNYVEFTRILKHGAKDKDD